MMNNNVTDQEKQLQLMEKVGDHMARHVEALSPVTLDFQPGLLYFEISGTENIGMLKVARNAAQNDSLQLRLQLGALRKGTDRLYSSFLPATDAQEMIRQLRDPAAHARWMEQIRQFSDSVDDYWD